MRNLIIVGMLFFSALIFPTISFATDKAENVPPFDKEIRHSGPNWVKILKLDDVQKAKFADIKAKSRPQKEAIMQQIETLRQQMANISADDEQKLRAILNEKQVAKFDKIKAREKRQHRRPQQREERRQRFKMGEK